MPLTLDARFCPTCETLLYEVKYEVRNGKGWDIIYLCPKCDSGDEKKPVFPPWAGT